MSADFNNEKSSVRVGISVPRIWWGLALGIVAAVVIGVVSFNPENLLVSILSIIFVYTFVASLLLGDNCATLNVIVWFCERSISFPGLIWEFSIDGFLWLIGMKLLFWLLGVLFGILCAIFGIFVGCLISPIAYVFGIFSYIADKKEEI